MTEVVLQTIPSQFPPSPSPTSFHSSSPPNPHNHHHHHHHHNHTCNVGPSLESPQIINTHLISSSSTLLQDIVERESREERVEEGGEEEGKDSTLSLLALLVTAFRKSMVACKTEGEESSSSLDIGWPTDVRHVAHVTFDRFHGFLGLPVEFEPEVPRRVPSASQSVFGVSTKSMQCSYDSRGNSVPTILILMQRHMYAQGGLQAEGIFRINGENSQEENVREQLNTGIVPQDVDVHCLAGLIKAWFRELPSGVLDSLSPDQVMQSNTEEECAELVGLLPPTEASLLDWSLNLMADVVQEEHINKMNARNVAMVFAPNMTKMADPLTALMYAVQVMNFLKTLIEKTLKERQESLLRAGSSSQSEPSNENGDHGSMQQPFSTTDDNDDDEDIIEPEYVTGDPENVSTINIDLHDGGHTCQEEKYTVGASISNYDERSSSEELAGVETGNDVPSYGGNFRDGGSMQRATTLNYPSTRPGVSKVSRQNTVRVMAPTDKSRGSTLVSRLNTSVERNEAWR